MTKPVTHFEIMGEDAIALQKFYHDVFGWKLAPPVKEMQNYSLFDNEGQGIGGGIGEEDKPRVTIYIEVDDPQAYLDKAVKAGAKLMMEVMEVTPDVTIAMFSDPAGNTTGLLKATPH
jgi:predicted enzyme related to lactoylglutathione lyase